MDSSLAYRLIADTIIVVHLSFVVFVVGGLLLVYLGYFLDWRWVRNPWFRILHLLGVAVVVVQSWFGLICPLTTWEMNFRAKAGEEVYQGAFMSYWLQELLYYEAPFWIFVVIYTLFGGLVLASWFVVRPRPFGAASRNHDSSV